MAAKKHGDLRVNTRAEVGQSELLLATHSYFLSNHTNGLNTWWSPLLTKSTLPVAGE